MTDNINTILVSATHPAQIPGEALCIAEINGRTHMTVDISPPIPRDLIRAVFASGNILSKLICPC